MAANRTRILVLVAVAWAVSARPSWGQAPGRRAVSPPAGFTNSVGMRLVQIPAGEFVMGRRSTFDELAKVYPLYQEKSPEGPRSRIAEEDDDPRHTVRITRPFYLGAHEVTVGQFRRFVAASGYTTEPERDGSGGYGIDLETRAWSTGRRKEYSWRNPGFPQGDDHPVVNVTWGDAVEFCRWLGRAEGATYRLPTEAEWEYACRAGTTTRYNFGDDPGQLPRHANTYDASAARVFPEWSRWAVGGDDGFAFTAPVGSFAPNAFGLYDMHGNVWEWCSDWYSAGYYQDSPVDDPRGPATGRVRCRRGGGWHVWAFYCRSCYRNFNTPESRYLNLGVRVVREADPPPGRR